MKENQIKDFDQKWESLQIKKDYIFSKAEDIKVFVELLKSFRIPSREVAEKLMEKFDLTEEEVNLFLSQE